MCLLWIWNAAAQLISCVQMTTINPTEVQFPIHPRLIDGTVVDPKEIRVTVDGPEVRSASCCELLFSIMQPRYIGFFFFLIILWQEYTCVSSIT